MEYIVIVIASILAGIGTGLVGLSAATVMVPLLIVLCPSFQGEHGAFMATAIALASDVIGSASTAYVYGKNKNIDLKKGLLLLICIISMCAVGSFFAYLTKQIVLGSFSLFLCVAIGIRFLIKPESKKIDSVALINNKLTIKQIILSIIFGLTIGFGTGYFGSGGGMMMLIIFTSVLGYERKKAVGTSTFIMTFTALIASVSHILIESTILIECWDFLIIGIVVATIFSIISARFANKVNGKIVSYITGGLLFALGLVLLFFHFQSYMNMEYVYEVIKVLVYFAVLIILLVLPVLFAKFVLKVPKFIFRKLLHLIAFSLIISFAYVTPYWFCSIIAIGILFLFIIVALLTIENCHWFKSFFVEKFKHEVVSSFIILFLMLGGLLAFFWGYLDEKYIAVTAILAWGPADGMAAIIGIPFGKHKISGKMIEGTKSIEGTLAMLVTSFICTFLCLLFLSPYSWLASLGIAIVVAIVACFSELFTKHGLDTITVPILASIVLFLFALL